jgi:hypothetical protein
MRLQDKYGSGRKRAHYPRLRLPAYISWISGFRAGRDMEVATQDNRSFGGRNLGWFSLKAPIPAGLHVTIVPPGRRVWVRQSVFSGSDRQFCKSTFWWC